MMKDLLSGTPLASYYKLIVALLAVIIVIAFLTLFLGTRLGLAIRATGNNPIMVKSSSINTVIYNNRWSVCCKCLHRIVRLPACPVSEVRQH